MGFCSVTLGNSVGNIPCLGGKERKGKERERKGKERERKEMAHSQNQGIRPCQQNLAKFSSNVQNETMLEKYIRRSSQLGTDSRVRP